MIKAASLGICQRNAPTAQNKNAASGLKSQAAFRFRSQALYIYILSG